MNKRLKCVLLGHNWKIHKDKKTITCRKCDLYGGFFKKKYIDEAWAYLSVYKKRMLF